MATLFTTVLSGMEDNNEINDSSFSDWNDAEHALDVYGENFECDEKEMEATKKALNKIIESNGEKYDEAVNEWNMEVWGQTFANNSGPVAFAG